MFFKSLHILVLWINSSLRIGRVKGCDIHLTEVFHLNRHSTHKYTVSTHHTILVPETQHLTDPIKQDLGEDNARLIESIS